VLCSSCNHVMIHMSISGYYCPYCKQHVDNSWRTIRGLGLNRYFGGDF